MNKNAIHESTATVERERERERGEPLLNGIREKKGSRKRRIVSLGIISIMLVVGIFAVLLFVMHGINVNIGGIRLRIGNPAAISSIGNTSIGTNVIANFNGGTGEVKIYSTSGIGTLNGDQLKAFFESCGKENIISIYFENEVDAPEKSTYLFKRLS